MALPEIPYDEWFDPNYKYKTHPYDNWPVATNKDFENPRPEEDIAAEISLHEKMYRLATENGTTIGGSENHE